MKINPFYTYLKSKWLTVILCGGLFVLMANIAEATEVRGRIDTQNPYSGYYQPMPGVEVALCLPNGNPITVTVTGHDGFYYFHRIAPGQYLLIINRNQTIPIMIPPARGFDIPPILYR